MADRISQSKGVEERRAIPDNPLVSIITPVLNGIKYLETCIQSVLNQGYPYIEHVFVDGGSTDGTLSMLTSYQAKHPDRIRFISEPDKSAEEAWNKGWRMARGQIFGWLGADDVYEPDAIMAVVEFFRANPDAYFVFGDCNIINERGEVIGKSRMKEFNLREVINNVPSVPTPAAFYKREVIKKIGFIDTSTRIYSDLDYWIRVGKVFQIYRIEKLLSNFRMHKGKTSFSKETLKMRFRESYIISRRHGGSIFSPRARIYLIYRSVVMVWALSILKAICPRPIWNFMKKVVINE